MQEFDTERAMMLEQHQREMSELTDIMFAMEQNFNEREGDAKSEFQSMRDEIKNKVSASALQNSSSSMMYMFCSQKLWFQNLEEKHALRVQLEAAVEEYWGQFQTALKNYQETTKEREKAFLELKAKDEKSAKEIEMQMRKLQRITVTLQFFISHSSSFALIVSFVCVFAGTNCGAQAEDVWKFEGKWRAKPLPTRGITIADLYM